ncbi:16S rRNA (guanine(527)-N(7))-methyltransferase RsmG [Sphingomonas sp. CLY1604]|uniref:16S rRNA (guanine(527)-N(7))-methyltransferase RsmG n=1 Tax=Sphingomonas sp. CLY1604 TaxID=3457786 RepID=UPI003FD8DC73
MTEDEARTVIADRFGEDKAEKVAAFLALVAGENERQNLIAPSTVPSIWDRHALDSAQLMFHVKQSAASWLDIGTGGGFPGIVVAILFDGSVTMVEPRKRRAAFLQDCAERLHLDNAFIVSSKVEAVESVFDIISARAVASVEKLLQAADHCAKPNTRWILPRGRIDDDALAALQRDRRRVFHVEHSLTDPGSSILIVDRKRG